MFERTIELFNVLEKNIKETEALEALKENPNKTKEDYNKLWTHYRTNLDNKKKLIDEYKLDIHGLEEKIAEIEKELMK